ncbi:fatty acid desaturase [Candidatus Endobugula sertula]|uniref:Fatty acid desaturase n=1 Tax=Candidatus Endobugula sertula TaxID=62101 RepID=A0A1D2QN95_9GAMM|nr:fatty acid desaturase [Candidatus Endobugula sertula]
MARHKNGVDKPRFIENGNTDASKVTVFWSMKKSLWVTSMYMGTAIGIIFYSSFTNLLVFLLTTAIVLCFDHSLGMHRRLIHNSFECPLWLEYILVYLGTLVGLGGPMTMIYTHDIRDWAQRKPHCHDYFAHRQSFFRDAWWQMYCDIQLKHSPILDVEDRVKKDKFYQFIERTTMLQQLPWAILFYVIGGWGLVLWGICARVAVCVTGHWLIGYFAHRKGHQDWHVDGAGVQGYNVKFAGLITFGESWHNNHHAFPGSAKIGLYQGQSDPGWWVLKTFERFKLVWNLRTPELLPSREELRQIGEIIGSDCSTTA